MESKYFNYKITPVFCKIKQNNDNLREKTQEKIYLGAGKIGEMACWEDSI